MKGHCAKFPFFMVYNCRESCGTCGFRSGMKVKKVSEILGPKLEIQWLPLESLRMLFYEAKLSFSEWCIAM